ncbi:HlyD family efflux transporter periplasmic adaptor subunit [Methylosinus sp. H3A]|uniref:HlyD family secretion protein n=1 Tax=Methylosinus sp. H3A TaxID=2785786 RepID=UPI0018C2C9ED|nr:HlyD family efflux transporter periplasmic adaptor subunit [Methylosinus sp. H3A]MBG0810206.1 HlyD family efflux transporter periplasmic adaptor subunit [Methylosinus sp. H3A]
MRRWLLLVLLIPLALGLWRLRSDAYGSGAFLGYVEGELLYIGPVEGERLARLDVEAGRAVAEGEPLFSMATPVLDRQRAEAAARLAQMQAQLENLRASMNRPQQIAVLQAGVERARAALALSAAEYERKRILTSHGNAPRSALDQAVMARDRDKATLAEAERQIEVARMPSRNQEIEAAQSAIVMARTQIEQLDTRIARQKVVAPAAGVVQDIFFRAGEMVVAGQPALSLLPPENRKVRFYVPQARLVEARLGARVAVECDGCDKGLWGRISFIAQREEYTPPVIFSDQERAKLVFKVEARLEEKARLLPLGLPVRVRLAVESAGP